MKPTLGEEGFGAAKMLVARHFSLDALIIANKHWISLFYWVW
ncbi:MAG: hypothetical protein ACKVT2_19335 [Saprospiraceae bacterium]